jgi:hypothetical protein
MAKTAMPDTIIENPILNSPFREPDRHWRFTDEGITNEVVETRRASAYFVPIPPPEKKGKQLQFDTEWTQDRLEPNDKVNRIRERVKHWREGEYQGITQITRKLLQHWTDPDRENKLFFCQIEALETLIYLTEAARKVGDNWIENWLRELPGDRLAASFTTIRETYKTRADKCHVSHVAGDSGWEFKLAHDLEDMTEVLAYVKNQNLGFTIPYAINNVEHQYYPDFLIRIDDGHGKDDPLNLILEVTGERKQEKEAKTATARTFWVPA